MTLNPSPPHLEVSDKKLFMSFGLLNRLTKIVGGADQLPALANSPELQEQVLLEVFTERPKGAVAVVPQSLEEIDVTLDETGEVLDWVAEHIYHFFMARTEKAVRQAKEQAERLQALPSFAPGSGTSPSTTPAA